MEAVSEPVCSGEAALQLGYYPHSLSKYWISVPIDPNMRKINLWTFYDLAVSVHPLTDEKFGSKEQDPMATAVALMRVSSPLDDLITDNPLQLSNSVLNRLKVLKKNVDHAYKYFGVKAEKWEPLHTNMPDAGIHTDLLVIQVGAKVLEMMMRHECEELSTFYIEHKGTHNTAKLLTNAVTNLPEAVQSRLSLDAKRDINAAGRCLALDSPTAAGFHILRAVEALMRDYYFKLTATHLPIKNRNWGAFIKGLDGHGADTKVTGFLKHIKDHYRNVLIHPEESLTSDEAFALFNTSLSAITMLDTAIQP